MALTRRVGDGDGTLRRQGYGALVREAYDSGFRRAGRIVRPEAQQQVRPDKESQKAGHGGESAEPDGLPAADGSGRISAFQGAGRACSDDPRWPGPRIVAVGLAAQFGEDRLPVLGKDRCRLVHRIRCLPHGLPGGRVDRALPEPCFEPALQSRILRIVLEQNQPVRRLLRRLFLTRACVSSHSFRSASIGAGRHSLGP